MGTFSFEIVFVIGGLWGAVLAIRGLVRVAVFKRN